MIEASIYSALTGDATLASLVGTKVRPVQARIGDSHPLLVYTVQDVMPIGDINCESDTSEATLILDSYSRSYLEAASIDEAASTVFTATHGRYPRTMGDERIGSVYTDQVDNDSYVLTDDNDAVLYRRRRTLVIWFEPNS